MTADVLRLLLACSAFWIAAALLYGWIAYKAGWREGHSEGWSKAIDYSEKHINTLVGLGRRR